MPQQNGSNGYRTSSIAQYPLIITLAFNFCSRLHVYIYEKTFFFFGGNVKRNRILTVMKFKEISP